LVLVEVHLRYYLFTLYYLAFTGESRKKRGEGKEKGTVARGQDFSCLPLISPTIPWVSRRKEEKLVEKGRRGG